MNRQYPLTRYVFTFCSFFLCSTATIAGPKVAFIGDQGVDANAQAVLSLIAEEGTDLLLIQGDLGYGENTAEAWNANLDSALGADFPVLSVVGNHDDSEWPRYRELIQNRLNAANSLQCNGNAGVEAVCQFDNLEIVQVSPGINEVDGIDANADYAGFIRDAFAEPSARWRICSWHKNQREMQTGEKGNGTGWDVYQACLDAGALIATGHEHAYSRTHLLSSFENQTIVNKDSELQLQPGQSFAFVSGLGGWQVRPQVRDGDWWASIYTATQGATHGALFCTFEAVTADCYFKAIDGSVPDQFSLRLGTAGEISSDPLAENSLETPEPAEQQVVTTAALTIQPLPAPAPPAPSPAPPAPAEELTNTDLQPEPDPQPEAAQTTTPDLQSDAEAQTEPETATVLEQNAKPVTPALSVFSANTQYTSLIVLLMFLVFRRRI